jgi:hypothetical protein
MHTVVRKEIPSIDRPLKLGAVLHMLLYGCKVLRDGTEVKAEESGGSPSLK